MKHRIRLIGVQFLLVFIRVALQSAFHSGQSVVPPTQSKSVAALLRCAALEGDPRTHLLPQLQTRYHTVPKLLNPLAQKW